MRLVEPGEPMDPKEEITAEILENIPASIRNSQDRLLDDNNMKSGEMKGEGIEGAPIGMENDNNVAKFECDKNLKENNQGEPSPHTQSKIREAEGAEITFNENRDALLGDNFMKNDDEEDAHFQITNTVHDDKILQCDIFPPENSQQELSSHTTNTNSSKVLRPETHSQQRQARFRAFFRSLFVIDHTNLAFVSGMRTALIIMLDWTILGIGNPTTTAFQLGALYVGLTDPNGNLSRRLHYMGITLVVVVVVGTLLPGLVWRHPWAHFVVAILVAFATGLSPLLESPALFTAMKLGTALFAINGAVNRNTNGYGGLEVSVGWTFFGGSLSLLSALLPEMLGNREAARSDLFKVYHGFGESLKKWSSDWGTREHFSTKPVPFVTLSIAKVQDIIFHDNREEPEAREWLLRLIDTADDIRAASLCLSNGYEMVRHLFPENSTDKHKEMDALFHVLGRACRRIARRLQFPWVMRHSPCLNHRLQYSVEEVTVAVAAFKRAITDPGLTIDQQITLQSLPAMADLLEAKIKEVADQVLDVEHWPPFSPVTSLPKRIAGALPSKMPRAASDTSWAIRGYAIRFAVAFSLASIPELFMPRTASAHWFPMTVALIMGPTHAATFGKVAHRTVGTLLGIGLGSVLIPLFDFEPILIVLLGLNTYAVCVFFQASYVAFTCFITAWVFCTTVGTGAPVGTTAIYRCVWTLAAALLVTVASYIYPPNAEYEVTKKLAAMARAIKAYAMAVVDEHNLRYGSEFEDEIQPEVLEHAHLKVKQTRKAVIKARVAMLNCINEAVLTPSEPCLVDPHSVAPIVASGLVDAVVVPQAISLLGDRCGKYLLSGLDEQTFNEIDRLVERLQLHEAAPSLKKIVKYPPPMGGEGGQAASSSTNTTMTKKSANSFSNAIAFCQGQLDEAGVPNH